MKENIFLLVLLVALGFASFLILKPFLTYILFSIILTIVSYPLYEKLRSKLTFAPLAAIIVIFQIIIVVIVPSIYLTITIFGQARDIITNIGSVEFTNLQNLENSLERFFGIKFNFAETVRIWIFDLSSTARSLVIDNIITFTRTVVNFLAGIVLMFFIMFYLFVDGRRLVEQVKAQLPIEDKYKDHLFDRAYKTVQGLFLGIFTTAILQGALAGVGYLIFGMPNVILLGFLTGVLALIPFLGPPVVYIPASLYLLSQGNLFGGLGLLLYGFLVISNIDNFFRPWIVRFRVKVHPLYVILGVVGGVVFLGFSGIVVGPLILTLFQEVVDVYNLTKRKR